MNGFEHITCLMGLTIIGVANVLLAMRNTPYVLYTVETGCKFAILTDVKVLKGELSQR